MEQRPYYRLPVEIDVWLYNDEDLHAKARIVNITKDGMFIKTDVMLLALGSEIKVVFEISDKGELQNKFSKQSSRAALSTTIIHRCLDGIGVRIKENGSSNELSIISLLAQITTRSYLEHKKSDVA